MLHVLYIVDICSSSVNQSPISITKQLSEYSHLHLNSTCMIASEVNGLYSKASTPYAIQLYFTLAMALENKNVSYTYLVHTQILYEFW